MAKSLTVVRSKWRRVVMVRFERAKTGDPDIAIPQPDDRGYTGTDHGPIFGVLQGATVTVRLLREMIDDNADLFVTSSDTSVFTVENQPADQLLTQSKEMDISIKGVSGGTPKTAKLQVRWVSNKASPPEGPIIHEASIYVWHPMVKVPVTVHLVKIKNSAGTSSIATTVTPATVHAHMATVNAVWRPCGIKFIPSSGGDENNFALGVKQWEIQQTVAGVHDETPATDALLLNNQFLTKTINLHFVHHSKTNNVAGWSFPVPGTAAIKSGIVMFDEARWAGVGGGADRFAAVDAGELRHNIAHELGHYLGLKHVDEVNSPGRNDTWARRSLMHPTNPLPRERRRFQRDVGYGVLGTEGRAGAMITMKNLTQIKDDGQCHTARGNGTTKPSWP